MVEKAVEKYEMKFWEYIDAVTFVSVDHDRRFLNECNMLENALGAVWIAYLIH